MVVVVALAIAAAMVLVLPRASMAWSGEPPRGHLVLAGETLWEIAVAFDPDVDTRTVVDRLRRINHLASVELTPASSCRWVESPRAGPSGPVRSATVRSRSAVGCSPW
ncbi:LysM peptidoglycan-binding domain-containing protein [Candidatus Frankia alpina]|uniref:LysM peptidoglycan-binding domain-containing protein n=1 Tax=Candidatus Frankia alpina TaxID=2699483 RepID=UPI0013D4BE1A|nr:LysM domain-containing protein [Candidatus Frankia alpina]